MNISEILKIHYGINIQDLKPLDLGADVNAAVFKADSYFVKLKQGDCHTVGFDILEFLYQSGVEEIIPPIKTQDGRLTCQFEGSTLVVYPFIDGTDGFSKSLNDAQWIQLGKTLKQVHQTQLPESILKRLKREDFSTRWRDTVRNLNFNGYMKPYRKVILQLVDQADYFYSLIQDSSEPAVLCHSDIHAGNLLLNSQGSFYIVDWDEPILAPKERDLMFIGGGIGKVWNQPQEEELFYQGYGPCEINQSLITYYRCNRILEDIAFFAQDTTSVNQHFLDMFETRGVVEIALKRV